MDDVVSRQTVKRQMIKYGFHAPDMTVTEFVEDLSSVNSQKSKTEARYCDRNICLRNEYNSIGCNECEVTKSQESNTVIGTGDGAYYRIKALQAQADGEYITQSAGDEIRQKNYDLISRKAVLDYIYNDLGLGDEENGKDVERQMELESSYRYVKSLSPVKLPSVVIPNKVGHWIFHEIEDTLRWYECDQCGTDAVREYDYCHGCGARMESEKNE